MRNRIFISLSFIALIISTATFFKMFGFHIGQSKDTGSIKVISFNASFFKLPAVYTKPYFSKYQSDTTNKLRKYLMDSEAEIICVQEFFNDSICQVHNILPIFEGLGYESYFQKKSRHKNGAGRGMVVLSKFPIIQTGSIVMSKNRYNGAGYADLLIGKDTIRIINCHFESNELGRIGGTGLNQLKGKLRRLKQAAVARGLQMNRVRDFIATSPYPCIVTGDFNETVYGYNYWQFNRLLDNAFESKGFGFGNTLARNNLLPLRIDHVFYSSSLDCKTFQIRDDIIGSDHFPIEATFEF